MTVSLLAAWLLLASSLTPEQQARLAKLENSLLAPCCYQERLATHTSDTAKAMRAELAQMVALGKPDREILDYYKQRYGVRVLIEPEEAQWWIMNVVPVAVALMALALVAHLVRKWLRASRPTNA
ncbi:MAG: cytochrome c-type biogenesis protein CcmH [Acidobacteriota bacterium]